MVKFGFVKIQSDLTIKTMMTCCMLSCCVTYSFFILFIILPFSLKTVRSLLNPW